MVSIMMILGTLIGPTNATMIPQKTTCKNPELRREVYEASQRPKSKSDYKQSVKFKLGSRKTVYRRGEMITVNLAMLNNSGFPIFIHQLSGPFLTWTVQIADGKLAAIMPRLIVLEGVGPQFYEYVSNDGLATGSFQLLVGCDIEGDAQFSEAHRKLISEMNSATGRYNKTVFDRDLFVNWGDACLSLAGPGTYTITAEMTNEYVVSSPCEPRIKTAVGAIQSTPLRIVIEK
jgi:hypothetical protein